MTEIRLRGIRLQNFKRHETLAIDFSDTLTVICGANYKGKSTVLEAIFFALFGTKAVPGGAEVITRTGSKEKAIVSLNVQIGETNYVIQRTPNSAAVIVDEDNVDNDPICTGHTAVNDWVLTRIGTTSMQRALALAFSSQGETQAILQMGAPALNRMIEDLTGVKYVDQLIDLATDRVKKAESTLDGLGELVDDPEELTQILDDEKANLAAQENSVRDLQPKLQTAKNELDKLREMLTDAQKHNLEVHNRELKIRDLQTRVEQSKSSFENLKSELDQMEHPEIAELEKSLQDAQTEVERLNAEAEAYDKEHHESDKHTGWLDENEDRLISQAENVSLHENKIAELSGAEKELKKADEAHSLAKNELQAALNAKKKAVCGECERPFDQKHLDKIQAKLPSLIQKRDETEVTASKLETKVSNLRISLDALTRNLPPKDWEQQILLHRNLAKASANRLKKLKQPNVEIKMIAENNRNELKIQCRTVHLELKRYEEAQSRMDRAQELWDRNKNELRMTKPLTLVSVDRLLDAQGKAFEQSTQLAETMNTHAGEVRRLTAEISDLGLRVKKAKELRDKRASAEASKARYGRFARWLRENKAAFLADTWAGILALVSEFSSEVTSGAIEEIGRDPDGDFWFRETGHVRTILAASGGQKSIVGVGLRLALPSLLPASLGFVAMDEASSDLNEEHAAALAGALRAAGRQVILVTHREGEEFSSDATYVLD